MQCSNMRRGGPQKTPQYVNPLQLKSTHLLVTGDQSFHYTPHNNVGRTDVDAAPHTRHRTAHAPHFSFWRPLNFGFLT